MKAALTLFLLLVAALAQSLTPAAAWLGTSKPPFLLAVALYYALTQERGAAVTVAMLAGILQDSLSLIPLGFSAFWFTVLGLWLHRMRGVLFRDSLVTVATVGAVAAGLTVPALYGLLVLGTERVEVSFAWLMLKMGGNALLGLAVMPAVWLVAATLEREMGVAHSDNR
jgi:rod shape-determining protein MreD